MRRIFREPCPWLAACLAPLIGLFTLLLSAVLLVPLMSWTAWALLVGALMILGGVLLRRLDPPENYRSLNPKTLLYLIPGLAGVLIFCSFHQAVGMVVDGDFFVHAANIGLFARGYLPPVNPFLGVPMHGHYGRDLAIAIFFRSTGLGPLTGEWVLTTIWQALTFLILFFWLRREFDCDMAGVLGSWFAFFGMNFSAYCGLSELLANNNPVSVCLLIVVGWAMFRARDLGRGAWIAAGLLLGLDALIYESHFGVIGMSLGILLFRRPRVAVSIGLIGLLVGALLSGSIRSAAQGAPENGAEQKVRMRIFKKDLFQVRTDNLRPSRAFETKARPWAADFRPTSSYHAIWSAPILNVFWYPVWLLPLSTLYLGWRARRDQRYEAGIWWATLAWLSLLMPALIDFGVFEPETARWLVVTALGAAIALGVSLALCWQQWSWRVLPVLFVLVLINSFGLKISATDMVHAYRHPGTPLPIGRPGLPPGIGLLPDPGLALDYHYGITPELLQAAAWLRENSHPGQRFICDNRNLPTNARGSIIGAVGLLPAMEAKPPVWSRSIESYQANLQQRGFWETQDPWRLDQDVDWLLTGPTSKGVGTLVYENVGAKVYSAPKSQPKPHFVPVPFQLSFPRNGAPNARLVLGFKGTIGTWFELRFQPLGEQEFVADENLQGDISKGEMVFITPYVGGEYMLQARVAGQETWEDFGTFTTSG